MAPRWPGPKPEIGSNALEGLFDNLFGNLISSIVRAVMGIFIPGGGGGIPAGLNPLSWLSDLMGMRWDQVDSIEDGQLGLNSRVDLLSPLQDYGSCYARGVDGIVNTGKVPFNQQIGPMTGCHLASNGIVLDDKGLWDIRARVWFSWTASPISGVINWEIRVVRDSDGSVFSVQRDQVRDTDVNCREINTSVVIPNAGYRAEVWVTNLAPGRSVWGGANYNRFTVQHISRSTANPI